MWADNFDRLDLLFQMSSFGSLMFLGARKVSAQKLSIKNTISCLKFSFSCFLQFRAKVVVLTTVDLRSAAMGDFKTKVTLH